MGSPFCFLKDIFALSQTLKIKVILAIIKNNNLGSIDCKPLKEIDLISLIFPVIFIMYLICCDAVLILCYFKDQN